jgi:hypothetical protein
MPLRWHSFCRAMMGMMTLPALPASWQRCRAASRSLATLCSWHRLRPVAAVPTCAVQTFVLRVALLQGRGQAADAAPNAE